MSTDQVHSFIDRLARIPVSNKKTMFDIVARHMPLFGLKASWQLFEAGHGNWAYGIGV
jgi:hypothetical protein